MNIRQSIVALIVFASSVMTLLGQCDVTLGTFIIDNTTGTIEIVIDGAINDDLSNLDQAVCGVELFFEHESIRDISISLESPSGQSIVLIGPATGAGGSTQFTYWGVEFVPCDSLAMPDLPILDDQFTTEDNWGIFGNYSGQYYPQQGCLEDFNTGSVNGIWTLSFSDVIQFDEGKIDSMRLIFCDSTNIYCQECLADGGTLISVDSDFCESDPDLNLDIEPEFDNEPPIELYSYNYLIIEAGEVIEISQEPNLSGYSFGSYQLCGISGLTGQTDDILDDVAGTDYEDFLELLGENNYCASMSTNCISINIIEVLDTILIVDTICLGEVLILDGTEYSETGEYVVSFSQAFCDSVSILHLFVIENQATIMADSDAISCLDGDVILDATESIVSPNTVLNWFKVDDELDPIISGDAVITITEPGVYGLSLISDICSDTAYYEIFNETSIPSFAFNTDTLSCYNPAVMIDMTSSLFLESISWTGAVTSSDEDIEVITSGTYYVQGIALNGCVGNDSIFISDDFDLPIPTIDVPNINCAHPTVTLTTTFTVEIDSLKWTTGFGFYSTEQSPVISQGGDYYITIFGVNGCIFTDTISVIEEIDLPILTIDVPLLDCLNPSVDISLFSESVSDSLFIRLPSGELVSGNNLSVTEPNIYIAIAKSENGCIDSLVMEVIQDTLGPIASLWTNGQINCSDTTTTILVDHQEDGLIFDWYGNSIISPFGIDSIVVDTEGIYGVVITDSANCITTLDTEILTFVDFPVVTSSVDSINCTQATANITLVTPENTVLITWDGPTSINQDITEFNTEVAGSYVATVTADNNCISLHTITVVADTLYPQVDIMSNGVLDCDTELVTLTGSSDLDGSTYVWSDLNDNIFLDESLEVGFPGLYNLVITAPNTCLVDTFIIVEIDTLRPEITTGVDPIFNCADVEVNLSIETTTNIISYDWDGPLGFGSGLMDPIAIAPGIYTVTVTNDLGCSTSAEVNVIDDTKGPEIMVRDTFVTCDLLEVKLPLDTDDDEISYNWVAPGFSSDKQNPETNIPGEYIVYAISDRNECVTKDTVNVTYIDIPPIFDIESDNLNCYQPQTTLVALDVEDDFSAIWTDYNFLPLAQDSLLVEMADSFYLIVLGINSCADTAFVSVIADFEQLDLEILLIEPFQCENTDAILELDGIEIEAMEDFTVSWTTFDGNIESGEESFAANISGEGTYFLNVINKENGCESIDSIILVKEAPSLEQITIEGNDPNCLGAKDGSIAVVAIEGGIGPYQYIVNNQVAQSDSIFTDLASGSYDIQVIDSLGCTILMSIDLYDGLDFMATAETDTMIIVGDTINLSSVYNIPDEEVAGIIWTAHNSDYSCDDCFEPFVSPLRNTYYTLYATSRYGCQDSSQVLIKVNRNPEIEVANVFAPGSETNGLFYIQQTRGIEMVLSMSIFDKWASRIFLSENTFPGDSSEAWDGTYKGHYVNPGVYVVVAELLLYSGEIVTYAGDITVLR
ncbi:gliding motility-associated C-terminal domain-containing protein [Saprospiraceae bacterium]|nr:gliding motility-associated C-terminal domain-containing protein [Saprospiraceae bacterium]